MAALRYRPGPIGIARHAWINKPDTKYNADGLYHVGVIVTGDEAAAEKELLDAEVERAFAEEAEKAKLKGAALKAWTKYYPYIEELDEDNGNPTGRLIINYKQNAKIPQPDGSKKTFILGIRDAANKVLPKETPVYGGATIRAMYKPRNVKVAGTKQFGVRLDFSMVQLIKAAESGGGGFDEVEGGYVYDESEGNQGGATPEVNDSSEY